VKAVYRFNVWLEMPVAETDDDPDDCHRTQHESKEQRRYLERTIQKFVTKCVDHGTRVDVDLVELAFDGCDHEN